jgi:2',3'-cyclic-nucleotide 2'-phosphodiesterase (5'-nucleotidase family)
MSIQKIVLYGLISISLTSCSPKIWKITSATSTKIEIDSSTDKLADKNYENYLQPFKQRIDTQMNVVIGQAAETMRGNAPESLLSNFNADAYRQAASDFSDQKVDIAVVNLGGLRTVIPKGNITIRKVFELMPFENELVILWLKGDKLYDLLQFFASVGGEGVSGLRMEISNGKAVNITINGNPLDTEKLYTIATNDYLAGGNDKMIQLGEYEKRLNTGLKIRTVLLETIKNETRKGNLIQSKLDGRIRPLTP